MDETRLNRIRFRAWRRGFREADLILGPFVDAYAAAMSDTELDRLEALMEQSDHDIFGWIMDTLPVPPQFDDDLLARLRAFRPVGAASAGIG